LQRLKIIPKDKCNIDLTTVRDTPPPIKLEQDVDDKKPVGILGSVRIKEDHATTSKRDCKSALCVKLDVQQDVDSKAQGIETPAAKGLATASKPLVVNQQATESKVEIIETPAPQNATSAPKPSGCGQKDMISEVQKVEGPAVKDTPAAEAHDLVDVVLSEHYHRGSDDTSRLDAYLTPLADRELDIEEGLREALHSAVNRSGLPGAVSLTGGMEVDSTIYEDTDARDQTFDIPFIDMDFPSSAIPTSSAAQSGDAVPSSGIATASSSSFHDSSSMDIDPVALDRFEDIRESLNSGSCTCGGFKKVLRRFKTPAMAQAAHGTLLGDHHHLIDPYMIRDGERFKMTVSAFEGLCSSEVKKCHLKLYRSPLTYVPPRS